MFWTIQLILSLIEIYVASKAYIGQALDLGAIA